MEVTKLDSMAKQILKVKFEIAELEDRIDAKKADIQDICKEVEEFFVETNREEPYRSPHGTLYIKEDIQVDQPKGADLKALFDHFMKCYGEDIAWQKMTINNQLLKSEVKQNTAAVEERGGDPILEPLPGVAPPKKFKTLVFRKGTK